MALPRIPVQTGASHLTAAMLCKACSGGARFRAPLHGNEAVTRAPAVLLGHHFAFCKVLGKGQGLLKGLRAQVESMRAGRSGVLGGGDCIQCRPQLVVVVDGLDPAFHAVALPHATCRKSRSGMEREGLWDCGAVPACWRP